MSAKQPTAEEILFDYQVLLLMQDVVHRTCVVRPITKKDFAKTLFGWHVESALASALTSYPRVAGTLANGGKLHIERTWSAYTVPLKIKVGIPRGKTLEVEYEQVDDLRNKFNTRLAQLAQDWLSDKTDIGEFVHKDRAGFFYIPSTTEQKTAACMSLLGKEYLQETKTPGDLQLWASALENAAQLFESRVDNPSAGGLESVVITGNSDNHTVYLDFGDVLEFVTKRNLRSILNDEKFTQEAEAWTAYLIANKKSVQVGNAYALSGTPLPTFDPSDLSYGTQSFQETAPLLNDLNSWVANMLQKDSRAKQNRKATQQYEAADFFDTSSPATAPAKLPDDFMDYAPTGDYKPFIVRDLNPKKMWGVVGTAPRVIPQPPARKHKDLVDCFASDQDMITKIGKFLEAEFDKTKKPPWFVIYDAIMEHFSVESPYGQDNDALTRQLKTAYVLRLVDHFKHVKAYMAKDGTTVRNRSGGGGVPLSPKSPSQTAMSEGNQSDDE